MFISGHPLDDFKEEIKSFCTRGGLTLLEDLTKVNGRELRLAGIVTSFQERISKNNKPYGTFKLEDYASSKEFTMFGEDYLKYRHLLSVSSKVFVMGKVSPRIGRMGEELEFRISRIEPLFNVMEKMGKFLDLRISVDKITEYLIETIVRAMNNGKGNA